MASKGYRSCASCTKRNHVLTLTQIGTNGVHFSGSFEEEFFDMDMKAQGSDKKDWLANTIVDVFERWERINNA